MTTHDYTDRGWGHDYTIHTIHDGGQRLSVSGWGDGIQEGDYLILKNGERGSRYVVSSISYYDDPSDMWKAELTFAPRMQEVADV